MIRIRVVAPNNDQLQRAEIGKPLVEWLPWDAHKRGD